MSSKTDKFRLVSIFNEQRHPKPQTKAACDKQRGPEHEIC